MIIPKIEHPTIEEIDKYHAMFIDKVIELFEAEKHKYIANHEKVFLNFDWSTRSKFKLDSLLQRSFRLMLIN